MSGYRNTPVGHDPPDEDKNYSGYYRGFKPSPSHSKGGITKKSVTHAVPQQNFCGGCGNKLLIDSDFCVYCGQRCLRASVTPAVNSWKQEYSPNIGPHMASDYGPGIRDLGPHSSFMPQVRNNVGPPQDHGVRHGVKTRHSTTKTVEVRLYTKVLYYFKNNFWEMRLAYLINIVLNKTPTNMG